MNDGNLTELLKTARQIQQTPTDRERQRQSFTFGNTKVENKNITRDSIAQAARALAADEA